jgi:hypothetical protein
MHFYANPTRFLRIAKWLTPILLVSGLLLAGGALAWGFFTVPPDRLMGDTVRILFIHVPAAWLGMGGWTAIAIASLVELVWRHPLATIAARGVHIHLPCNRIDLGPTRLGRMVGVGRAADIDAGAVVPLFRLYRALLRAHA